jgi:quinohemoprotein ethanol dehydrogenase
MAIRASQGYPGRQATAFAAEYSTQRSLCELSRRAACRLYRKMLALNFGSTCSTGFFPTLAFGETKLKHPIISSVRRTPVLRGVLATLTFLWAPFVAMTISANAELESATGTENWPAYGRDFAEDRFSPLTQISDATVGRLGLAWSFDLTPFNHVASQPLAVDGIVYFTVGLAVVYAVDAQSGKLIWHYDPQVAKYAGTKMRTAPGSRGVAYWNGKVYVGTLDGRLIALNANSGKVVWATLTTQPNDDRFITGAPRVFKGKIIIGHGGGDVGVTRGYVTTYDAETGRQLWRFYTVPGNPAEGFEQPILSEAAKTWTGQWWKYGGGGAVWNAITYDQEFNRVYIGTGNGLPWNRKLRSPQGGDNLFTSSIVALDADSGEYIWHYQVNPGESWDYDAAMDMVLATVSIGGQLRKVLMQAPKNGFFYVIDRTNGKLISAEKIAKVTWADRIDSATGRPVEASNAHYENGEALVWPGPVGVHGIAPMSFSPTTGLVYIPTTELPGRYNDQGMNPDNWIGKPHVANRGLNVADGDLPARESASTLLAWNPALQHRVWSVATPGAIAGGTVATAGNLVFQGLPNGQFVAYAADSGKVLWSYDTGNGISAAPVTFSVNGTQYVSVLSGLSGGAAALGSTSAQFGWQARTTARRLLTFALDAHAPLPQSPRRTKVVPIDDPDFLIDAEKVRAGTVVFIANCAPCHGPTAVAGGFAPDLRASAIPLDSRAFSEVVHGGALRERGMPQFPELSKSELDALRHYVRSKARESLATSAKSAN